MNKSGDASRKNSRISHATVTDDGGDDYDEDDGESSRGAKSIQSYGKESSTDTKCGYGEL